MINGENERLLNAMHTLCLLLLLWLTAAAATPDFRLPTAAHQMKIDLVDTWLWLSY